MKKVDVAGLPPSKRFAYWSEVVCTDFSPSENRSEVPADRFYGELEQRNIGKIAASRVRSVPIVSIRDRRLLSQRPLDCYFCSVVTSGQGRLTQNGREAHQGVGSIVLYDSMQPFRYEWPSEYEGVWLRLPRRLVDRHIANAESMTARAIGGDTPVGALAHEMIVRASLISVEDSPLVASKISNAIMDTLAAALDGVARQDCRGAPRHANLLDRAREYMLAHIDDPDLSSELLVEKIGVSRRTLNRLFAPEGTTPVRWLWQKRLERSRQMLESGAYKRVADVALSCGFSDFSHFSRVFKTEFGVTPKSLISP